MMNYWRGKFDGGVVELIDKVIEESFMREI